MPEPLKNNVSILSYKHNYSNLKMEDDFFRGSMYNRLRGTVMGRLERRQINDCSSDRVLYYCSCVMHAV